MHSTNKQRSAVSLLPVRSSGGGDDTNDSGEGWRLLRISDVTPVITVMMK